MTASASSDGANRSGGITKRDSSEMMTTTMSTSANATVRDDRRHRPTPLSRRQRGNLNTLLSRGSPFSNEMGSLPVGEFEPSDATPSDARSSLGGAKILVVGAGGLGCEILKDLAMCDGVFRDVVVVDLGEEMTV
jgi:hypothetical protein